MRLWLAVLLLIGSSTVAWSQFSSDAASLTALPAPTDWWSRGLAIAAFVVSALTFGLGRYDKAVDRKSAKSANDPVVDFDLTRGRNPENYDYELTILNKGDVSIQLLSLSCSSPSALLKPDEADTMADGSVNYRARRIEPGEKDTLIGELDVKFGKPRQIVLIVKIRINDQTQRVKDYKLLRFLA